MAILIVDADPLRAAALQRVCETSFPNIANATVRTAEQAIWFADSGRALCILLNLSLPDMDGLDLLPIVHTRQPRTPVLVVSDRPDERTLAVLRGSIEINCFSPALQSLADLPGAIRATLDGRTSRGPLGLSLSIGLGQPPALTQFLSPHLALVFSVLGTGTSDDEASTRLHLSLEAVRSCRKRIMAKLGLHSQTQLMRLALTRGYVRIGAHGALHPGFEAALAARRLADQAVERVA